MIFDGFRVWRGEKLQRIKVNLYITSVPQIKLLAMKILDIGKKNDPVTGHIFPLICCCQKESFFFHFYIKREAIFVYIFT
jgi:hypothetical protein